MRVRGRFSGKTLLLLFALAFAVFFGLDMATRGMERIQGPMEGEGVVQAAGQARGQTVGQGQVQVKSSASVPPSQKASANAKGTGPDTTTGNVKAGTPSSVQEGSPNIVVRESFINHVSNRIGDALRRGAKAVIGLVVSLFDSFAR